jgi:hypothetical protein
MWPDPSAGNRTVRGVLFVALLVCLELGGWDGKLVITRASLLQVLIVLWCFEMDVAEVI